MSETPSILKVLLMTSSYLLSFLTHILSVKLKIPHTTPPPPPCSYQARWNANQN